MSGGVFNFGRKWILDKAFRNQHASSIVHLGLYTNARESLSNRSVLADIVACTGPGYAPIALPAASWTTAVEIGAQPSLDVAKLERANEIITASGAWGDVTGAYLFDEANGVAIAWRDGVVDYSMALGAKYLVDWLSEVL